MNPQEGASSTQGQGSKGKRLPFIDGELFEKMRVKVMTENRATERIKRVVKYEPTKMIWKECVTYYRRSTNKQDTTIETQQDTCMKRAAELGVEVVKQYSDEISGKSEMADRSGMSEMMREIKPGRILIVYSISRIARQIEVFYGIMKLLKERGCRIICCHEKLDSLDPHMEVIWAVHAAFAQQEREAISARTRAALQTMKKNGQVVGRPRWGYKVDPETKKLVPIPEFQEVLQSIINMRREDRLSLEQICHLMNELKVPTPSGGGVWERRMIATIVKHELGEEEAKRLRKPSGLSKKRKQEEMKLLHEDIEFFSAQQTTVTQEEIKEEEFTASQPESEEDDNDTTQSQTTQDNDLYSKPTVFLKAMLIKRRHDFGLTEEDIKELSKDDMIELLK